MALQKNGLILETHKIYWPFKKNVFNKMISISDFAPDILIYLFLQLIYVNIINAKSNILINNFFFLKKTYII